jgi:hypothetical protein
MYFATDFLPLSVLTRSFNEIPLDINEKPAHAA